MRPPPDERYCQFCSVFRRVPAVGSFTDTFGYEYRLCERHYEPLARWRVRLHQTAEQRMARRLWELERRRGTA